jgi:putative iron-regulated protein
MIRQTLTAFALTSAFILGGHVTANSAEPTTVMSNYADIAKAKFSDSLQAAEALDIAIGALIANPNDATLQTAKNAWLASRVPYMQTEVYRFGNAAVDDWEGKVNAWPLDEGLIDYVASDYGTESDSNKFYTANVIANETLKIGGETIDASTINVQLLQNLHEAGGVEANVATGYHAIEFLLWGQDLNGSGPGAGNRPSTDFAKGGDCTNGNCDRRAAYLKVVSELLVSDLQDMVAAWDADGEARKAAEENGITAVLTGMGSLSYGELAGERMKLGLLLHDPEEEHDCFADNTHNSHFYDVQGIQNVYLGTYNGASSVSGASLSELVKGKDTSLDTEMRSKLAASMEAFRALKARAEAGETYDQMIAEGNDEGNALVQAAIDALVDQTRTIERIAALTETSIEVEGSDSLDNPNAVFE